MIFLATEEIQDVVQSPEEVAKDVNRFVQWFEDQIPTLISFGIKVVLAIVFFFIGRAVIHGIQKMVKHSMQRANADTGVIQFVESFLKFGNRSRAAGESFELCRRRTDPAFKTVCSG